MISGRNHITLAVRDVQRSFQFYVETLGTKPLARWSRGAYLLAGDLWLCLTLDERTRSSALPEYSHIAFSVREAEFNDASERIRTSGATIWKENFIFSIRTATRSRSMPGIGGPGSRR